MADEVIETLRLRIKEHNNAERTKRRELLYNKKRKLVAEDKFNRRNDMYLEAVIIDAANSIIGSSKKNEVPFTVLKEAFIQSPQNAITFMRVEGALHYLVGFLMSQNPFDQLLAAETCCNLSLGDSKTCFKFAKAAAPYLISILQGLNYNLMAVIIQTCANLSGGGERTCQILLTQGILSTFGHTLCITELREPTSKALIMLTRNASQILKESEIEEITRMIIPYFDTSQSIQWLTYLLSSLPDVVNILIGTDIPMKVLTNLSSLKSVKSDNIISVTSQVRILGNLSSDSEGIAAHLMLDNWSMIITIMKILLSSAYRHLSEEAYWSLGNILQHKSLRIQEKLAEEPLDLSWLGLDLHLPNP